MNRIVTAHTPLDPELLKFRSMQGSERLSSLYAFEVELIAPTASLDMKSLIGRPITLEIQTHPGGKRYLGGNVTRCELTSRESETPRNYIYTATLRPSLWFLTRTIDCRIFQNMSVVSILDEVFARYGFPFEKRLSASYRSWEYCVQYQETDFAFVNRLMEQEGIYYYFRHEYGQQTLILADDIGSHDVLPDYAQLPYLAQDRLALPDQEGIDQWQPAEELRGGVYSVDDYDFKKPKAKLGQVQRNQLNSEHGQYEKYLWQGGYIDADEGIHYARVRLEEEQAEHSRVRAHSKIRGLACGFLFSLKDCPREQENREYLLVGVSYVMREAGYATGSGEGFYDFSLIVQPSSLPFRAPCDTPVPKATGPQTAVVVGPPGEQIWTDRYGRVKLQFRWDRYGKSDENSSCWVRVSDAWAGTNFGGIYVPRIGQEVVVDFLNGQLDRPLITGRIYNAEQMPPFELPQSRTQSGFVTRTPGGSAANANIFRFEDKPGGEQIKLHAERNYDASVENDSTLTVARQYLLTVGSIEAPHDRQQTPLTRLQRGKAGAAPRPGTTMPRQQVASAPPASASAGYQVPMPGQQQQQATNPIQQLAQNVQAAIQQVIDAINLTVQLYSVTVTGLQATVVFGDTTTVITGNTSSVINGDTSSDVNGNTFSLVNGSTESIVNGNVSSLVNGNTSSVVDGNTDSLVNGNSASVVGGNTESVVSGNTYSEVGGNTTSVVGGDTSSTVSGASQDEVASDRLSVTGGSTVGIVAGNALSIAASTVTVNGSAISAIGSTISVTGSNVSNTGSNVSTTGSSVSTTGSSVSTTGSSVSTTGSNISTIGSNISYTGINMSMVGLEVKF